MVQCMMVINLRVMNVQASILASFKGNLAIWQVLVGEGLAGPWASLLAERKHYINNDM